MYIISSVLYFVYTTHVYCCHEYRYTEEEIKQLKQLYSKYGKNWTIIGQQMGRSSDSVKDRCRLFVKEENNQLGKFIFCSIMVGSF